jgi:hypothetical protein
MERIDRTQVRRVKTDEQGTDFAFWQFCTLLTSPVIGLSRNLDDYCCVTAPSDRLFRGKKHRVIGRRCGIIEIAGEPVIATGSSKPFGVLHAIISAFSEM